jgi:hypothetical protein
LLFLVDRLTRSVDGLGLRLIRALLVFWLLWLRWSISGRSWFVLGFLGFRWNISGRSWLVIFWLLVRSSWSGVNSFSWSWFVLGFLGFRWNISGRSWLVIFWLLVRSSWSGVNSFSWSWFRIIHLGLLVLFRNITSRLDTAADDGCLLGDDRLDSATIDGRCHFGDC